MRTLKNSQRVAETASNPGQFGRWCQVLPHRGCGLPLQLTHSAPQFCEQVQSSPERLSFPGNPVQPAKGRSKPVGSSWVAAFSSSTGMSRCGPSGSAHLRKQGADRGAGTGIGREAVGRGSWRSRWTKAPVLQKAGLEKFP